ncbi:MAG: DUF808 domain-containing protein [Vibrio sp.]
MAGASLLTLLDDISTVLDDVSVMSKVAAKKTTGLLGDDLALNAEQVSGVEAKRELPVVWGVAKGSFRNKCILVPLAMLISAFVPWLLMPLLMLGGFYLSFEGAEKIVERFGPGHKQRATEAKKKPQTAPVDLERYEKQKIKGAIRTDFILSAEIIVIALGTVQGEGTLFDRIFVVSFVAILMTAGVYGLVAVIVKLDDLGFYLKKRSQDTGVLSLFGNGLINFAPKLMKCLTVVGTLAMFLVGGGIIVHNIPLFHHSFEALLGAQQSTAFGTMLAMPLLNGLVGLIAGLLLVAILSGYHKLRGQ